MPAQRLPWIKFWPELLDHPKFAELTDAESWGWVVIWSKASQQSVRWRFVSLQHAVKVTGRKAKEIQRLIEVGLIDQSDDGSLYIHNAPKWQQVYPSDYGDGLTPTHPRTVRNGSSPDTRRLREDSVKAPSTLREDSSNGAANAPNHPLEKEKEIESKTKTIETPPAPAERPPSGGLARTQARESPRPKLRTPISDAAIEVLVLEYGPQFGSEELVRDWIARALNHAARLKALDEALYVERTWLKPELAKLKARSAPVELVTPGPSDLVELIPGPQGGAFELDRVMQECLRCHRKRRLVPGQTLCDTCQDMQAAEVAGFHQRGAA